MDRLNSVLDQTRVWQIFKTILCLKIIATKKFECISEEFQREALKKCWFSEQLLDFGDETFKKVNNGLTNNFMV